MISKEKLGIGMFTLGIFLLGSSVILLQGIQSGELLVNPQLFITTGFAGCILGPLGLLLIVDSHLDAVIESPRT